MAENVYSETVQTIIDGLIQRRGDSEITADEAKTLYGGEDSTTVKELESNQLVQVALLEAYALMEEMDAYLDSIQQAKPNRETRRKK